MRKLLIVGSNSIHIKTYLSLIDGYFDNVLFLTEISEKEIIATSNFLTADFSVKNPLKAVATILKIRKIIATYKPSVIHIHQANTYAFLTLLANKTLKIPIIVTAWGSDVLLHASMNFLQKQMLRFVLSKADYYTADAKFVGGMMQSLSKRNIDICIANFGVDVSESNDILKKEKLIYSNRLHNPLYRIDKIITAFHSFSKQNPDWRLVFAGTGSETENLKSLVKTLELQEKIVFTGWIDKEKNIDYYKKACYYVSIPESDGTSVSLLEAMVYGCIPVVSELPANKEWVNNGENGFLVADVDSDFLSGIFTIDIHKAASQNIDIIKKRGSTSVNREIFISAYEKLNKKRKS
ncbi:MAG: glycosyltransferase [Bacteroidales bacterium]|nr:glycosyltransferase [Bacteroidales bacterium]